MVNKMFQHQIEQNMEVYVDDILVKSRSADTYLIVLGEAFSTIKKFRIGLNPAKCALSISS